MRDILSDVQRWIDEQQPVALATVVQTWGSGPRGAGAKMAITPAGGMAGSVSGGCIEGATFEAGVEALQAGRGKLIHYGIADETAWEVGLACGGSIDVFVQPLDPAHAAAVAALVRAEAVYAVATLVKGSEHDLCAALVLDESGAVVHGALPAELAESGLAAARAALASGNSQRTALGETAELFVEVAWPAPTLVVVGGVHTAITLTQLARGIGYRTVVIDPRKAFGNADRFPHVDRLITEWPDDALTALGVSRATAIALLTHDPKLDDPGLLVALRSPAFYVGALGSKGTQEQRRARLLEAGVTEAQLARLRGPIGLDLGGRTPEEIAVSILADVVAARNGKTGRTAEARPDQRATLTPA